MLRKRSRPVLYQSKDHLMQDSTSDVVSSKEGFASLFSVPGIFVGLCSKGSVDCDSARSPTSPLELRAFPFARSPRSPSIEGGQSPRSWECSRVGLGLVDSLNDASKPLLGFTESKRVLFGSQMRINIPITQTHIDNTMDDVDDTLGSSPKSLPKDYGISSNTNIGLPYRRPGFSKLAAVGSGRTELELEDSGKTGSWSTNVGASSLPLSRLMYHNMKSNSEVFSSDGNVTDKFSGSSPISISSAPHGIIGSLSQSEIEQSEDYTCIVCHGPNPKTTHIFGDCILEGHAFEGLNSKNKSGEVGEVSDDFLTFCFTCKKKLEDGKDIYIYRGEKAFCSCECREQEILVEEQMEKPFEEEMFL